MDRIPVSQQKEIKVDDIDTGTADFNSKKGLLQWKINLPSKSLANFKFSYTIKYPKYKFVNI